MSRNKDRPKPMSAIIDEVAATIRPGAPRVEWPDPIGDGHWVDQAGVEWAVRGGRLLNDRAARRLLKDPAVTVLHSYDVVRIVVDQERAELIDRVELFLRDEAPPFSDFDLAEFRSSDDQVMVVVRESC